MSIKAQIPEVPVSIHLNKMFAPKGTRIGSPLLQHGARYIVKESVGSGLTERWYAELDRTPVVLPSAEQ